MSEGTNTLLQATEANFKDAKRRLKDKKLNFRRGGKKKRQLQILDGVLARPFHSLENSFELILKTWIPPPAKILDPTAGPRWMWRNLLDNSLSLDGELSKYEVVFGDIAPQSDEVRKVDATQLSGVFEKGSFDGLVVDPPYRRNVKGGRYDIERFKGDQNFNLDSFFGHLNEQAYFVLKETGKLIVKIGDSRITGNFEPWDMIATKLLSNFVLEDRVIRRPFYMRKVAITRRDRATLVHETFLLYSKKFGVVGLT